MSNSERLKMVTALLESGECDIELLICRIREIVGTESKGRRVVQIAAVGHENNQLWQGHTELFALCDDGSLWAQSHGEPQWHSVIDIPQDEPAEPDPIAEVEAQGAVLRIDWDTNRIVWAMDADGLREPIATHMSNGSATLTHLRAAAARLLARVRGGGA